MTYNITVLNTVIVMHTIPALMCPICEKPLCILTISDNGNINSMSN